MTRQDSLKSFGSFIKESREKAGFTQAALGAYLGLHGGQFISNLERGLRPLPARHIPLMAIALGIEQESLVSQVVKIHEFKIRDGSQIQ